MASFAWKLRDTAIAGQLTGLRVGNVCVINEGHAFGGAEVHTLQLVSALAARGHTVHVIECAEPVLEKRSRALGISAQVQFSSVPLSTQTNAFGDISRWAHAVRLTGSTHGILIKNWFRRGSLPFLLAFRSACPHISFIEHLEAHPAPHDTSRPYLGFIPRPRLWLLRERLCRKLPSLFAEHIVAVSGQVRERLISDCGYPPAKVSIARNGVDHQRFIRDTATGTAYRASLNIPADRLLVVVLARLEHDKGIDIALSALRLLRDIPGKRPVHLLIAGSGSLETELRRQARDLGVQELTTFAGFLSDPRPALWAADVILFPSRLEGLPLGLLEGMAAGCVPVVTRVSGMPEVVSSREIGSVVEPEDAAALAGALRDVASLSPAEIETHRAASIAHIRANFDLTQSQKRLISELGL